ncbi:MAG: hypothetical protein B6A08_00560 [Sorangiineae bacterium NIC37A_2]|jgi:hypothetical protein|nr:MAG: hypothetical protein B6A08_00560 [Sorangiineae bacterium NIC37A_2]
MTPPSSDIALQAGALELRVLPSRGGRISSLSYQGVELLSGPEAHPDNWGTTYWPSPQNLWGWPPVAAIDSEPFAVKGEAPLVLRGQPARLGETEVVLEKRFVPLEGESGFEIAYELHNVGKATLEVAGWQISRVLPGGLTFFPTGDAELTPIAPHGALHLEKFGELSVFDHQKFEQGTSLKVHADGRGGYLAHLARPQGSRPLLFVKAFPDLAPSEQAPGEGEVEIFANLDGAYVEIEVQGKYETIPPGESSKFTVRWIVSSLPDSLLRAATATACKQLAASLRERAMGAKLRLG